MKTEDGSGGIIEMHDAGMEPGAAISGSDVATSAKGSTPPRGTRQRKEVLIPDGGLPYYADID